jgi:hypothetical protein
MCAVLVATAVAAGGAGAMPRASAPLPQMSSFALATTDFSAGGGVASQSTRTFAGDQMFIRVFKPGRIGSTSLLTAVSLALLESDEPTAALDFSEFKGAAQVKSGRQAFAKEFALAFVNGVKTRSRGKVKVTIKHTTVGAPVLIGENAFRLPLTFTTNVGALHMAIDVTQTDRVLAIAELMPEFNHTILAADATAALTAVQRHLHDAFTVASTSPPTITGSAVAGQAVTLDEGSWTGAPSSFTYAWSDCDATGASCTPIAGATGKTYTVGSADVGFTLRVTVTGTNSVGSQQGMSAATAVVS